MALEIEKIVLYKNHLGNNDEVKHFHRYLQNFLEKKEIRIIQKELIYVNMKM